jgi:ABC-type Zn uptake system ZnuABC Zn-binding protein ZnuA
MKPVEAISARPSRLGALSSLTLALALVVPTSRTMAQETRALEICVTTTDLASIVESVGGDAVRITSFTKGRQDPHFVDARPSFVKALSRADLIFVSGLDLEAGWLQQIVDAARNDRTRPGSPGWVDASTAITPLGQITTAVDRSAGDVHPRGNPHYLLDPVNGVLVARLVRDRLAQSRPADKERFAKACRTFETTIAERLLGKRLVAAWPDRAGDLIDLLARRGTARFRAFLAEQRQEELLGGWLADVKPIERRAVIADHDLWPYFAHRFEIRVVAFLEPKPGIPPTTKHLGEVVERARDEKAGAVLMSPYFNERHARFISDRTGLAALPMAHQAGARDKTDAYADMVDYNVRQIVEGFSRAAAPRS